MISWFRYVRPDRIAEYERQGWTYLRVLGPWSVLMRWTGDADPPETVP